MSADGGWSPHADPPRDPRVERLLRAALGAARLSRADHERLHAAVMASVRRRAWWEVAADWLPAAAAAGIVVVLVSALVFFTAVRSGGLAGAEQAPPETAAVAQVIARYPGDDVLASLLADEPADGRPAGTGAESEP